MKIEIKTRPYKEQGKKDKEYVVIDGIEDTDGECFIWEMNAPRDKTLPTRSWRISDNEAGKRLNRYSMGEIKQHFWRILTSSQYPGFEDNKSTFYFH